ncbi:UDP pyrophosphate phosphatase [Planomonospora sphaerica]|uniref:Undecaprenyl-diphosphatase n=3 Tax=Planomonospora TaxID=1998 RepID=A0A171C6Z4_9ACTN|nr:MULTISPECIES: undecaprenyl-diphosphate phosphatase [Planomonospora]GAT66210.1 UDP pyrophosphate phosphatase [Planomonospora sphaerica]GGK53463.1 undecaprenyl-diphosphatase [Planomonospora parontospora]GGL23974.1 undecaprenyl-diphosphatase [Planomonospora parontospora subsp. antibiotica]GII07636.1 undecaprenyl-diphosphatase [Planomonospora parontospora subsp. parontospora]GII15072.1 undecaprenyl-diphosphatase [Planomonospora parontospora subsp. antibiotica]
MIGWFEAVVLGLLQGLTEFLPISSSAHIRVVSAFLGWPDPGAAFTAVIQLGTEAAVLIYFRKEIWEIISTWTRALWTPALRAHHAARMGWYVIVGTLPILVLGLLFEEKIDTIFRDLRLIGTTLIVFGLILWLADRKARDKLTLERHLSFTHSVVYGLAQSLALIPGVSRSGGTITAGLLLDYRREEAAKYSFLLAIPAVLGAGVLKLFDIGEEQAPAWGPTILATVISFAVGYAAVSWFLKYISTHRFTGFVIYRVVLGVVIIALVSFGVLDPSAGQG